MEIVKDKIMYQVATDRNYKVGDILTFGKELNGLAQKVDNPSYKYREQEKALEEARKAVNPELPSRLTCMYLSDDKKDCFERLAQRDKDGIGAHSQVIAIKLNGKIFKGDQAHLLSVSRPIPFDDFYKIGINYWKNAEPPKSKPSFMVGEGIEYLFEGQAEVIEILKEYIHKKPETEKEEGMGV